MNKYLEYEYWKRRIVREARTPQEYEKRIIELAKRLGL